MLTEGCISLFSLEIIVAETEEEARKIYKKLLEEKELNPDIYSIPIPAKTSEKIKFSLDCSLADKKSWTEWKTGSPHGRYPGSGLLTVENILDLEEGEKSEKFQSEDLND